MKTVLTLRYASFLFCNKLSLVKNTPIEVDTDLLTDKDVKLLNSYIKSGGITSSNGPVPDRAEAVAEVQETVQPVIEIKAPEPEEVEDKKEEEVEVEQPVRAALDVLDAPAEEKKAPAKKPAAKKVAK